MLKHWYDQHNFTSVCHTLRTELPRLTRREILGKERETSHHRRLRLLNRVHLLFQRIPDAALPEVGPGVRGLLLAAFLRPEFTRRKRLQYFRAEDGDGYGYILHPQIAFKPPTHFEKELLSLDPDKVIEHFRSQTLTP